MDEWKISLDYVRGSNIYVRGYLDLRAWSLRLRAKTQKNHYGKALFPSREGHFSLRWIRRIRAIRRRACIYLRRGISGSWACDALVLYIEGRTRGGSLNPLLLRTTLPQSSPYRLAYKPFFPLPQRQREAPAHRRHFVCGRGLSP